MIMIRGDRKQKQRLSLGKYLTVNFRRLREPVCAQTLNRSTHIVNHTKFLDSEFVLFFTFFLKGPLLNRLPCTECFTCNDTVMGLLSRWEMD